MWRSHASSLQLPLQQPVHLTATALQLPSGAVALSITLSLDPALKTAFILHQAGLRPQFGLILGPGFSTNGKGSGGSNGSEGLGGSRAGFSDAVPLVLVPGGTAGLSFLLLPDSGEFVAVQQFVAVACTAPFVHLIACSLSVGSGLLQLDCFNWGFTRSTLCGFVSHPYAAAAAASACLPPSR